MTTEQTTRMEEMAANEARTLEGRVKNVYRDMVEAAQRCDEAGLTEQARELDNAVAAMKKAGYHLHKVHAEPDHPTQV